jgi:hypothetical protein
VRDITHDGETEAVEPVNRYEINDNELPFDLTLI